MRQSHKSATQEHFDLLRPRVVFGWVLVALFVSVLSVSWGWVAASWSASKAEHVAHETPDYQGVLKTRSIDQVVNHHEVVTNANWQGEDFEFINATLMDSPLMFTKRYLTNFKLLKDVSTAILKADFDSKTKILELIGEAAGMRLHSFVEIDLSQEKEFKARIVRGDLVGFDVESKLWDVKGSTLCWMKGRLPGAKKKFPFLVAKGFPTIAEIILTAATKNFRSLIESEYTKMRSYSLRRGQTYQQAKQDNINDIPARR